MSTTNHFIKQLLALILFISLKNLININCKTCKESTSLDETDCFNGIIKLNTDNGRYYRAGHFATSKNGDLIIQYSGDGPEDYRLFYALKKDGRGFFNDNNIKEKQLEKTGSYIGRYESRNLFIHIYDDPNVEYLFSTSSYSSVSELYDLENDQYVVRDTQTFMGRRIFSYVYNMLETKENGNTIYFIFFTTPMNNPDDNDGKRFIIKKLKFPGFQLDYDSSHIKNIEEINNNNRVICGFLLENDQAMGVLFIRETSSTYVLRFFDYNLDEIGSAMTLYETTLGNPEDGHGKYLQAVYLKDNVVSFLYFHDHGHPLKLQVLKLIKESSGYTKEDRLFLHWNDFSLNDEIYLNDIYKIEDDRLAFASTASNSNQQLYIILLDFFNDFRSLKTRYYSFTTSYTINKEFQLYSYNGFLVFTSTINNANYDSILMFFGYPNGEDLEIDIGPYLMNADDYSSLNNLYIILNNTKKIENNIFGYKSIDKIKLISIPEQLIFYANSESTTPLQNGDEIDINLVLYENRELLKDNVYYYLDFQFMVEDVTYSELCENAHGVKEYLNEQSSFPTPVMGGNILYGRVNRLKFKLCHEYCETCKRYGSTNNDQYCETCLSTYTYDYLTYVNRFTGNCVPSGYMYDIENHVLIECITAEYKYYLNHTRNNDKYCFKYSYECPDIYPYLNTTNNECIDYTVPATTISINIPTTIQTKIPTTIQLNIPSTNNNIPPSTIPSKASTSIILTESTTENVIEESTENPTQEPTEKLTEKPTEAQTEEPTEKQTEKLTEKPTEKQTEQLTEEQTEIITEKQTEKLTEKQAELPTEKPTEKSIEKYSTLVDLTPTKSQMETTEKIIIENKCSNIIQLNSAQKNLTNQDLYEGIKKEILQKFLPNSESISCLGNSDYNFQVTTGKNEIQSLKNRSDSVIILGDCEEKLKQSYNITGDLSLIIYKFYKKSESSSKNEMQFEVYNPYTYEKLDLSICDSVDLYIPININQDFNIYQNIMAQGFDPFDINDKFYRDVCTHYSTANGTDVLLDAREEYFYSPIANQTSCQENCRYSSYSLDTQYLKCECDLNNDGIVTLDLKNINEKNNVNSFYSSLKLTNYKVVICYNLVFNFKLFCHNYGSIISICLLGAYIISIIFYCLKTIHPLKVEISKFLFDTKDNLINPVRLETEKMTPQRNDSKKNTIKNKSEKIDKALPPKKAKANSKFKNKIKINKKTPQSDSINLKDLDTNIIKTQKKINNNDIQINSKVTLKNKEFSNFSLISKYGQFKINEKNDQQNEGKNDEEKIDPDSLDNYELNNMDYDQACEYDRRTCFRTYISVLMREELVLFTFFSWHDYNLIPVKIARLFLLVCTNMALNALFFFHKTMYKKQDIEENLSFFQKLPQFLFVLAFNHIIEVYICYLSMTDSVIHEIKELAKKPNNGKVIIDIIACMKKKLTIFFVSAFILFLIFWYFISAFCAVYQNTQIIFIRDSMLSFLESLVDPFIIFGCTVILRKISLSLCCRKKAGCLYKISNIIPIF